MTAHRTRTDLADADPVIRSTVDGEALEDRYWGAHYLIIGGTGDTRVLPSADHAGQRLEFSVNVPGVEVLTFTQRAGDRALEGGNTTITSTGSSWFILESFLDDDNLAVWRLTYASSGAELAA